MFGSLIVAAASILLAHRWSMADQYATQVLSELSQRVETKRSSTVGKHTDTPVLKVCDNGFAELTYTPTESGESDNSF
jgi:hypothetical protein